MANDLCHRRRGSWVLEGDLWLRGSGDPQLVIEDLWLLVQRLRGVGVREIRGNLMLDRSAFEAGQHDPGAFDGEALRPYNAGPDALLLNYKAVSFHFIADYESKQARVYALPALAGLVTPPTVRGSDGPCHDWRARLGGDFNDPLRPTFVVRTRCHAATRSGTSVCSTRLNTPKRYSLTMDSSGACGAGRSRRTS